MKKNKGFTLVELLAVIIILAILLVIAVPSVVRTLENAQKNGLISYAQKVFTESEKKFILELSNPNIADIDHGTYIFNINSDLNMNNDNYRGYVFIYKDNETNFKYSVLVYDDDYYISKINVNGSGSKFTIDDVQSVDKGLSESKEYFSTVLSAVGNPSTVGPLIERIQSFNSFDDIPIDFILLILEADSNPEKDGLRGCLNRSDVWWHEYEIVEASDISRTSTSLCDVISGFLEND